MQHLITTGDFTKEEILKLYDDARVFLDMESREILKGKIIVVLFLKTQQELEVHLKQRQKD